MSLRSALCRLSLLLAATAASLHAQTSGTTFAQPTVIPTGNWPAAIYSADINADGHPDLIYIDQGAQPGQPSTTHVLLNDGAGHFKQTAVLITIGNSLAVSNGFALGGGGQAGSLVWLSPINGGVTVHEAASNGDGTYAPTFDRTALYPTGLIPLPQKGAPVLGYLTYGRVGTSSASVFSPYVFAQDLTSSILYQVIFNPDNTAVLNVAPLPAGTGPAAVIPFTTAPNGPGSTGAVLVDGLNGTGTLQIFPYGALLSGPATQFTGVSGVRSFLGQDVNGDGINDLIAEGPNGRLDVFFGNGDGSYQTVSSGGTGSLDGRTGNGGHLITLADLNHDGQLDALTATPAGISSLLGQGTAYLGLKAIANAGPGMHTFATADFDGDGNLDLATDSPEGIAILFGSPDGTFQTSAAYAAGQPAMGGVISPLTGSGHTDVAVSTGATQSQIFINDHHGLFTAIGGATQPTPSNPDHGLSGQWSGIQTGDFNGDSIADLAITADGPGPLLPTSGSGLTLLFGAGDGTFQPPVHPAGPASPQQQPGSAAPFYGVSNSVRVGDPQTGFDILFNRDAEAYRSYDYQRGNNPAIENGYFGTQTTFTAHAHDLIIAGALLQQNSPTTGLLGIIAQQDGDLLEYPDAVTQYGPGRGNLHLDGSLTTPGQLIAPDISATFPGRSNALGFRAFPGSMTTADLDGDGNGDLLVVYANLGASLIAPSASAPNYLYIWYGSGGGRFLTSAAHPVNPVRIQLSRNYYQVAVADLNGDGIPDLILSDGYLVSIQNGKGDGTFGPETHLLAGQGINSLLLADVNGDGALDLITANGGAVLSNPVANLEVLATNPDVNTGGITVLLGAPAPKVTTVTGTLTIAPNPIAFEAGFTVTATITAPVGSPAPTGSVTLTLPNVVLTAPVLNGLATFVMQPKSATGTTPILPGTYNATASYSGDANYAPLNNLTTTFTINRGPTSVLLTPTTPLQTQYGGPVDGTFAITVLDNTYPTTGTGTVYDNGVAVPICTALPVNVKGTAIFCPYGNPVLLDAGSHSLQVGYDGDPINAPSISPAVTYVIAPDPTTTTNLTSSAPIATLGQPITFTATVTGTLAVPVGTVTFSFNNPINNVITPLGTGTLNATGTATLTISSAVLGLGTFNITAIYAGNSDFNPSGAGPIPQIVVLSPIQVASSVSLTSSVNPSVPTQPVTFTATVSVATLHPPVAPGTITFFDGQTTLATVPLNSTGSASYTTATLTGGTHPITATYSGATGVLPVSPPVLPRPPGNPQAATGSTLTITPSVSPVLNQLVNFALNPEPIGFTMTVTPVPVTLGVGRTAVLLVQVTPVSGFAQPVALSCGNLPYEATCVFAQSTIPAGGGATTVSLATEAPHNCGDPANPYFLGQLAGPGRNAKIFAALFLPALTLLGLLRRRKPRLLARDLLLLTLACSGLMSLSGCGRCTDLGTGAGTFSITVIGSAVGTPVSQTQSLPVQLTTHY